MLQPFKLSPTYRDYVWGGTRLRPEAPITAESWVIYEGNPVATGPYSGQTLEAVARQEGAALLGSRAIAKTGSRFPLLIKLLDCAQWLSLQVHPNDEQASRLEGPDFFGKTEAWFVVEADPDAQLISGFRPGLTPEDMRQGVGNRGILDLVQYHQVRAGDTIFMPPGTIHALGPGLLIYEVQQTSDLTYRVYDWDRPLTGSRQLHIDQANQVLDPSATGEVAHLPGSPSSPQRLVTSRYFALDLWHNPAQPLNIDLQGASFSAITALSGSLHISTPGWGHTLQRFESLLVPAQTGPYQVDLSPKSTALHAYVT
jgi:mannose-6-phosphate isomerase